MDVSILKVALLSGLKLIIIAEFRMTVFRPFVGEVLSGRIMAATHRGIRISLEFFDDIFIPDHLLFTEAKLYYKPEIEGQTNGSDHGTQSWKLPVGAEFFNYLEKDDVIRFKVEEETFKEATPAPPKVVGSGETEQHRNEEHKEPVYSLIVLLVPFSADGRGVVRKMGSELPNGGKLEVQECSYISGYPVALACLCTYYWGILLGTPKLSFHLVFVASPELKRLATAADRSVL